jgi:2,3-bisphosphoglycerate-independent phosphoglycerate mutase
MSKKTILMILDGWGKAPNPEVSAVDQAKTPFIDSLYQNFSHNDLYTDGMHVGLPEGQMGNSEVGHMNLGAGRIVYQDLAKINLAIAENTLKDEVVLKDAMAYAKANDKTIHLLGLLSNGGVHSHVNHVKSLLNILSQNKCAKVALHGFTDGRDVDPAFWCRVCCRFRSPYGKNHWKNREFNWPLLCYGQRPALGSCTKSLRTFGQW